MNNKGNGEVIVVVGIMMAILVTIALFFAFPMWNVWRAGMAGEALFRAAEQTRQIQVLQAKGELEASKLRAEAIAIVGKAAHDYPEYRNQEFIGAFAEALHNGNIHQIIYVPTEAGLPITEAGRRP